MNWLQTSESPSDEVLSAANLEWLEQQLRICDEECGLFPASNFCPTRLIDVSWGNSRNGIVRLIETRTDQAFPSPQYAALSYCWGSKEDALTQLKTTTSNLTQHLKNIPFQLMTPIIRDTIHLCRLLRIRYLWVDALCILQDDGEDWAREAAQMGSVYTNAYVTICTPTTSTCRDSFLHRTTPIRVRFESTVRPGINGYLNLRHQPTQHLYCMHTTTFECDMDVGTWRTRAWTFQEEQLSKRRLYFGATRMYLSCPRKILTEPSLSRDSNTVHFHDALNAFKTAADYARLYDMWIEFIKDYASRELTFERDRFPAISGLASLVAEATGDEYIVGLWKNDIVRGLLWAEGGQRERDMVMGQRCRQTASPMTYACPSWSWAAGSKPNYDRLSSAACGPDPIREAEWELRSQCKLITTLCEPENLALSRFGRVRAAKLHLQAKLLAAGNNWRHLGKQKSANQWKCAISDECVATYDLDWMVKGQEDYWTVENQKESLNVQDIHMLLLASTVGGDWSWESNHYTPLASPMDSDCEESSAEDGDENSDPDSNEQNLKSNTKSTYPATHKAPSTATSLQVVENEPLKRHAWGLLLLPVDKSDTFIRVGRFKIWAQMGGLTPFENCVYRHVEII
ncbi:hypothetical protein J1614_008204 [Plenodomus biglobosus]|nr:hypothetical protein J1614_008204 [Plenodomus biglobosus]